VAAGAHVGAKPLSRRRDLVEGEHIGQHLAQEVAERRWPQRHRRLARVLLVQPVGILDVVEDRGGQAEQAGAHRPVGLGIPRSAHLGVRL